MPQILKECHWSINDKCLQCVSEDNIKWESKITHKISEEKIAKIIKNIKDEDGYRVYLNQNPYRLAKAILKAIEDL